MKIARPRNHSTTRLIIYIFALAFNGLIFRTNVQYSNLKGQFTVNNEPQILSQRSFQIVVYIINSISTLINFIYLLTSDVHLQNLKRSEQFRIIRWVLHLVSFAFILIIYWFFTSQYYCYFSILITVRPVVNAFQFYYSISIATIVVGPFVILGFCYLIYYFFKGIHYYYATQSFEGETTKIYNKIFYFVGYIGAMVVIGLNFQNIAYYRIWIPQAINNNIQSTLFRPIQYTEVAISGIIFLLTVFLFIKQIYQKDKIKHQFLAKHLCILSFIFLLLIILIVNRIVELIRYADKISISGRSQSSYGLDFMNLLGGLKTGFWLFIFLFLPTLVYSLRNKWQQYRVSFKGECQVQQNQEEINQDNPSEIEGIDSFANKNQEQKSKNRLQNKRKSENKQNFINKTSEDKMERISSQPEQIKEQQIDNKQKRKSFVEQLKQEIEEPLLK